MFKKFMNLFFEEETETVVDEGEVETVTIKETVKEEKVRTPEINETVAPLSQNEKPKSTFVDLEPKKEEIIPEVKKHVNIDEEKTLKKTRDSYYFSPVISPIFGVSDKEKEKNYLEKQEENKKMLHKSTSKIGTVISPYYGIKNEVVSDELKETVSEESTLFNIDDLTVDDILISDNGTYVEETIEEELNLFSQDDN